MATIEVRAGDAFKHVVCKLPSGKPGTLRVDKVTETGVVVAHLMGGSRNVWAPNVYYFGKGLFEEDVTWIKREQLNQPK